MGHEWTGKAEGESTPQQRAKDAANFSGLGRKKKLLKKRPKHKKRKKK